MLQTVRTPHGSAPTEVSHFSVFSIKATEADMFSGAGQWIMLTFPSRISMNTVYLYDRGNPNDQIASGRLRFDDGSTVSFGGINNDGEL